MMVVPIIKLVREIMMISVERTEREALGSPADVAAHLQLPVKTLAEWRARKVGPQYHRVGRYVRYRWQDVEEWLAGRKVQ
jgi:hypothetical protein